MQELLSKKPTETLFRLYNKGIIKGKREWKKWKI